MNTEDKINLLLTAVNDLWAGHFGGYGVKFDDPNRDVVIAASKARVAYVEAIREKLAEAAAQVQR